MIEAMQKKFGAERTDVYVTMLVMRATNAKNVLGLNLDLFEGEESTDERDSYEEAATVCNNLHDALQPFEKETP
jgi:hypothetical protein|tara:strand:+ start:387 stop:608 length:222 start_codon:yes stop_codon:yes gene_type:complete